MMLIVVSCPIPIANEASYINELFNVGMERFHLRKPDSDRDEYRYLLGQIDSRYHQMIALHQHHELALEYGINRLHFTESHRRNVPEDTLSKLAEEGYILTTSIHYISDYGYLHPAFDYCFLGPVFDSVSKKGYKSKIDIHDIIYLNYNMINVVAIGGITKSNIEKSVISSFQGVAVLGAIWKEPASAVNNFKELKALWNTADPLY